MGMGEWDGSGGVGKDRDGWERVGMGGDQEV